MVYHVKYHNIMSLHKHTPCLIDVLKFTKSEVYLQTHPSPLHEAASAKSSS